MDTATVQITCIPEEKTRMEIRNFINEGLKDVENNDLYDFDEVFDEIENKGRKNEKIKKQKEKRLRNHACYLYDCSC